jgi:hypothetical protein
MCGVAIGAGHRHGVGDLLGRLELAQGVLAGRPPRWKPSAPRQALPWSQYMIFYYFNTMTFVKLLVIKVLLMSEWF